MSQNDGLTAEELRAEREADADDAQDARPEGEATEEASLAEIEAEIEQAKALLKEREAAVKDAKVALAAVNAKMDALVTARERAKRREKKSAAHIRRHLQSQLQSRLNRAKAREAIRNLGIDAANVGPAPIDQVMQRKTGYGKNRPDFAPAMKNAAKE